MSKKENIEESGMLSKNKILELFHYLDNKLNKKIRLIVGGGAAIILKYGVERRTTDVDIIKSSIPIINIKDKIEQTAHDAHIPPNTLNDHAGHVKQYLPQDYEDRLTGINEKFKNLEINFISKVDLVIMKLSVDTIRDRDINDIAEIKLSLRERNLVQNLINNIPKHDPQFAQYMENKFIDLKPESSQKPVNIAKKGEIKTLEDLCEYSETTYKIKIPDTYVKMWRIDLLNGETTIDILKKTVDSLAAKRQKNQE